MDDDFDKEWDDAMRDDNEAKAKIDKEMDDDEAKEKTRVIKRRRVKEKLNCSTISLSIVIRSHGSIDTKFSKFFPLTYNNEDHYKDVVNHFTNHSKINEVIPLFDYKNVGIDKLIDITPSKFGGSCYGNSDLRDLIVKSSEYYKNKHIPLSTKMIEIFTKDSPSELQKIMKSVQGISYFPTFYNNKSNHTINKTYTKYDDKSMISLFMYEDNKNEKECNNEISKEINHGLRDITIKLNKGDKITKEQILKTIRNSIDKVNKNIQIDNLYYIDLTCNAYIENFGIKEYMVNALNYRIENELLEVIKIGGGRENMRSNKRINKHKSINKRSNKRKSIKHKKKNDIK